MIKTGVCEYQLLTWNNDKTTSMECKRLVVKTSNLNLLKIQEHMWNKRRVSFQ